MKREINRSKILIIACYMILFLSSSSITNNVAYQESSRNISSFNSSLHLVDRGSKFSMTDFSMINSSFDLYSTQVGDEYKIQIGVPSNYNESPSVRYPTIYLIDANYLFDGANPHPNAVVGPGGTIGIIEELIETGFLPPCILVGIDYEGNIIIRLILPVGLLLDILWGQHLFLIVCSNTTHLTVDYLTNLSC